MKVLKWFQDHFEETVLACFITLITIVMFIQVVMRYIFKDALSWSDELCRYSFVWMTFFGIGYATKKGSHLKVDVIEQLVPALKKPLNAISDLALFVFCVYLMKPGYEMMSSIAKAEQLSVALEIPMWIVYLSFFIGMILTMLHLIAKYIGMFIHRNDVDSNAEEAK